MKRAAEMLPLFVGWVIVAIRQHAVNKRIGRYADRVRIYAVLRVLLTYIGLKSFKLKLLTTYMVKS